MLIAADAFRGHGFSRFPQSSVFSSRRSVARLRHCSRRSDRLRSYQLVGGKNTIDWFYKLTQKDFYAEKIQGLGQKLLKRII